MKTYPPYLLLLLFCFHVLGLQAQRIENVAFAVFGSSVVINYDLLADLPKEGCTLDLYISASAFDPYQLIPREELSGDIGSGIKAGKSKAIHWKPSKSIDYPAACFKLKLRPDEKAPQSSPENLTAGPLEMVWVEGGSFMMGNKSNPTKVNISSFYIGKYEVTQKQWFDVMGSRPSNLKDCDNCPVEKVEWNLTQEFIKKIYAQTGEHYRLPTEAEWLYAASGGRLGSGSLFAGGDKIGKLAWYLSNSKERPHPVGTKAPNELGIYDMTGNVSEWCNDWWASNPTIEANALDPQGPRSGDWKLGMGGGFQNTEKRSVLGLRTCSAPEVALIDRGFRLVYVP